MYAGTLAAPPVRARSATGTGLYADCPIAPGARLYDLSGVVRVTPTRLTLQIAPALHIDPLADSTWHFINHSCTPNVAVDFTDWSFRASRPVAAGEELSFNYLTTEWSMATPFPCKCGTPACVGFVAGFANLTPDQRRLLAPLAAPHLARLAGEAEAITGTPGLAATRR